MERRTHNTPQAYRYLLHRQGDAPLSGIAWKCSACASAAIPIGDTMNLFDRWTGRSWQTRRVDHVVVELIRFWSDGNGKSGTLGDPTKAYIGQHRHNFDGPVSVRVADYLVQPLQPVQRFGRGSAYGVDEPATIVSIEAFLKGARA